MLRRSPLGGGCRAVSTGAGADYTQPMGPNRPLSDDPPQPGGRVSERVRSRRIPRSGGKCVQGEVTFVATVAHKGVHVAPMASGGHGSSQFEEWRRVFRARMSGAGTLGCAGWTRSRIALAPSERSTGEVDGGACQRVRLYGSRYHPKIADKPRTCQVPCREVPRMHHRATVTRSKRAGAASDDPPGTRHGQHVQRKKTGGPLHEVRRSPP